MSNRDRPRGRGRPRSRSRSPRDDQNRGRERREYGDRGEQRGGRGGQDRGHFGHRGPYRGGHGGGPTGGGDRPPREEIPDVLPENIEIYSNFFEIQTHTNWKLNQYHVDFDPPIEGRRLKIGLLLTTHANLFPGNRAFDGQTLFTTTQLPDHLEVMSRRERDNQDVKITIRKTREISATNPEFVRLLNVVFKRCLTICNFKELGRNRGYFNMELYEPFEHMNVVSGYKAIIENYGNRLLLCAEIAHKLINKTTVLDFISDQVKKGEQSRLREIVQREVIGQTIITRYNNRTYKIDEIIWDKKPSDTFEYKNGTITFIDYYRQHYNIDIKDKNQPLLLSIPKAREKRAAEQAGRQISPALLIPELCYLTGPILLKPFEKDFRAKNNLARITKQDPSNTHTQLVRLVDQINSNSEARNELNKWGLRVSSDVVRFESRVIGQKNAIIFGEGKKWDKTHQSWNNMFRDAKFLSHIDIDNWLLVYGQRDEQKANSIEDELRFISRPLGFRVSNAERIRLQDSRNAYNYVSALKERINRGKPSLVVCLIPSINKDIYDAVKKLCCIENGIPSQVITCRVLEKNTRSVMTKIGIQISAKLGAEIWGMPMPANSIMVVGMNVYKDQEQANKTVAAFVSSINGSHPDKLNCTKWFSQSALLPAGQEFADNLSTLMIESLKKFYKNNNNQFPIRIIVYRDGLNESQYNIVKDHEVSQFLNAFKMINPDYKPQISVIVVKKRSNARFFIKSSQNRLVNPYVGTVIDSHVVDQPDQDFYLISQQTNQGTVNPTHYDIVYNTLEFGAGKSALSPIQVLTYKLTHLYYNWPGQIRVPAPCHYAYKLAFLIANSLHNSHNPKLNDNLFYL